MKIKLTLLFIFAPLLFLSGCLNYEQITTINKDGSGEMYIHYWTRIKAVNDSSHTFEFELFNKDSVNKNFSSKFTSINSVKIYKDFKDSTIHTQVKLEFTKIDSLNRLKVFQGTNYLFENDIDGNIKFSQNIDQFAFYYDSLKTSSINIIYYMPGTILSHNANYATQNKLEWILTNEKAKDIKKLEATFEPFPLNETPKWVYAAAIFVIIIVIIFLFKSKKN